MKSFQLNRVTTQAPITILLIEDDEEFRALLEAMLEDEGYSVLGAASGELALEIADKSKFDLVVTDVKLGGIDGLDTLAELKRGRSELQSLVITGYATEADSIRAISLGVGNYLKKPFKLPDFLRAVEEVVKHIVKERQQEKFQRAVMDTALWGLELLCDRLQSDDKLGLVTVGRLAEAVATHSGLSQREARQLRLAVLAFGVSHSDSGDEVPFLLDILPEQSTWLVERLESEDGDTEETEIAKQALKLAAVSKDEKWEEVVGDTWAERFRMADNIDPSAKLEEPADGNLLALARAFEASGDFESAGAVLSRLEDQEGQHTARALVSQARLHYRQGDHHKTREMLEKAQTSARSLRSKSEVLLEGGLMLSQLGEEHLALDWLQEAEEGFGHLQDALESARAKLATAAAKKEQSDSLGHNLAALLSPTGLEKLLASSQWLFPYLLSVDQERHAERARLRIARDLPQVVCQIFQKMESSDLKLQTLEIIKEVGTEGYDDLLQELILGPEQNLAKQAKQILLSADSLTMAPVLRLYSLGTQATWVGEKRIPDKGWTGLRPSMVLTYLAQNQGQFLTQDHLIDLFWEGSLKGNKSLNQSLVVIRNKLRSPDWPEKIDYVKRQANLIGINPDQNVWHDATVLKETLAEAQSLMQKDKKAQAADLLERAMDLDRGPYLENSYDDWALSFRNTLERSLISLLTELAEIRLDQSRPEQALTTSQQVLKKEPFSNRALASLFQALIDLGRPEEAVRTYERVEPRMQRELGIEPAIEVVKLYHRAKLGI